jgi:hypothetical protein
MKRGRAFSLLVFIILSTTAIGVEIEPTNVSIPSPGGIFSFDFVVTPQSPAAQFVQLTIGGVSGPAGGLTFNVGASEAVETNPDYWAFGNSVGATAQSIGSSFRFDDGADNPPTAAINNKIIGRFAFTWNGAVGDYIFSLDRSTASSYVYLENFTTVPVTLPAGQWYTNPVINATDSSFTIHIPEPATMLLLSLGGIFTLRKRKK